MPTPAKRRSSSGSKNRGNKRKSTTSGSRGRKSGRRGSTNRKIAEGKVIDVKEIRKSNGGYLYQKKVQLKDGGKVARFISKDEYDKLKGTLKSKNVMGSKQKRGSQKRGSRKSGGQGRRSRNSYNARQGSSQRGRRTYGNRGSDDETYQYFGSKQRSRRNKYGADGDEDLVTRQTRGYDYDYDYNTTTGMNLP